MRPEEEASAYFLCVQALKSPDPSIRRPAISALIDLAQQATPPIRARASAALMKEFGPFVVIEGLSGCAGPILAVYDCEAEGRDCRGCEWLWTVPPSDGTVGLSRGKVRRASSSPQGPRPLQVPSPPLRRDARDHVTP